MLIRSEIERLKTVFVGAKNAIIAGSGTNNTEVTGSTIDRAGFDSCLLSIAGQFAIADTKTLSYTVKIQESANGSDWDTAETIKAATVVKTADSSTTFADVSELEVAIAARQQYIRFLITANLNASSTDAGCWAACAVLSNAKEIPLTKLFTW